jgi:putative DNA primase/helicase
MTGERALERFQDLRRQGDSWRARCPAHADNRPSLSLRLGPDDRLLLHCHAGCAPEAILSAVGLTWADVMPAPRSDSVTPDDLVATYEYTDTQGTLLYQVLRYVPKTFRQRRPDGAGGWVWQLGDVPRVLFGLPELQQQNVVYIVEGEKDALTLRGIGLAATTNAGGAGKWRREYAEQLHTAGVECVVVLPDNDDAGRRHASTVARSCSAAGMKVKVVALPTVPPKGDVSDWLDTGRTRDELITLVKAAPLCTLNSIAADHNTAKAGAAEMCPVIVTLADVRAEPVMWIWDGRIAAGKLALLVGDPGLGKSWITLDIAARVSSGNAWPDGSQATTPANVLLLSAEDGLADTIRPRLDRLGADVTRVHHLAVLRAGDRERAVQLSDTSALERAIVQTGARVVIIDPISAYLGQTDSHRDSEVRGLMAPLASVADKTGVAVLGVMHLAKSAQRPAIYRAVGSIAFAAAARIVLAVAADPNVEGRRFLAPIKSNLSASPLALAYTLEDGRLSWEAKPVTDLDVDSLLSGPAPDRNERGETDAWLRQLLVDGPVESREIEREAKQVGIARRSLFRAKTRLGVKAARVGFGRNGKWYWRLGASKDAAKTASCDAEALFEEERLLTTDLPAAAPKSATAVVTAQNTGDSDLGGDII